MIKLEKILYEIKLIPKKDYKKEFNKIYREIADIIGDWEYFGDPNSIDNPPRRGLNNREIVKRAAEREFKKRFGFNYNEITQLKN